MSSGIVWNPVETDEKWRIRGEQIALHQKWAVRKRDARLHFREKKVATPVMFVLY
jgi:hypothetical protein